MKTYNVKSTTADALRAAAPKLGLNASQMRETVAPGIEALHLPPFVAAALDMRIKRSKKGVDASILSIVKGIE